MRILYLGDCHVSSTSRQRADALSRFGCEVVLADPYHDLMIRAQGRVASYAHFHTGYRFVQKRMVGWCGNEISRLKMGADAVWVDGGELFGPQCIRILRKLGVPVILYNHDDPTGHRDGGRFGSLREAIPFYDLCAVARDINVQEFRAMGARDVIRFTMGYDEVAHRGFDDEAAIPEQFRSDVAFIGTWMRGESRDEFLLDLASHGLKPAIWGARWEKSRHWQSLKKYHRGGSLAGRDYVAAIQGAKICLGLLSKGNRDLSTTRSAEIPYARGLLCAERTTEHLDMYKEGEEAVFWRDSEECAEVCLRLLADNGLRSRIRERGHQRILELGVGHEDVCRAILTRAFSGVRA